MDIRNFPYQVSLLAQGQQFCGGSIVSSRVVVTAAHCVEAVRGMTHMISVRAGSNNTDEGGSLHRAMRAESNPEYNNYNFAEKLSDVGIIVVDPPFEFDETKRAIPLPYRRFSGPKDGSLVTISGFGRVSEGGPASNHLKAVSVPVVPLEECKKVYNAFGVDVTEDSFCGGYKSGRRDSCQGDSGGPLVQNGVLVGIVSYGIGCGEPDIPGVYENVVHVAPYISNFIDEYV